MSRRQTSANRRNPPLVRISLQGTDVRLPNNTDHGFLLSRASAVWFYAGWFAKTENYGQAVRVWFASSFFILKTPSKRTLAVWGALVARVLVLADRQNDIPGVQSSRSRRRARQHARRVRSPDVRKLPLTI